MLPVAGAQPAGDDDAVRRGLHDADTVRQGDGMSDTMKSQYTVRTRPFSDAARDGCIRLLAALKQIPEEERLDATAMFVDVAIQTYWMTRRP